MVVSPLDFRRAPKRAPFWPRIWRAEVLGPGLPPPRNAEVLQGTGQDTGFVRYRGLPVRSLFFPEGFPADTLLEALPEAASSGRIGSSSCVSSGAGELMLVPQDLDPWPGGKNKTSGGDTRSPSCWASWREASSARSGGATPCSSWAWLQALLEKGVLGKQLAVTGEIC